VKSELRDWVESARNDRERELRMAIHTVMSAMAASDRLRSESYVKGGQLMAIRYGSIRYTTDLDISNPRLFEAVHETLIPDALQRELPGAVDRLDYNLDCRVQGCKKQPPQHDASFVTLKIRVGYAQFGTRQHKRLRANQAAHVMDVDYSFNEEVMDVDRMDTHNGEVRAYGLITLMAEKYRALLQQPLRKRERRQDVYDLDFLIRESRRLRDGERSHLARTIHDKARSRGLEVNAQSMSAPEIYDWSKRNYASLADELRGELPDFDPMFERVRRYFEALPWRDASRSS
jgi:hypothetical protein